MRVLRRENGGFVLENDFYKIRILYCGNDYSKALAAGELSAEDIFVTFFPKIDLPFSLEFVLKTRATDQQICINCREMYNVELTEVDRLCEDLVIAKNTISDVIDAMDEYFPGVLVEGTAALEFNSAFE